MILIKGSILVFENTKDSLSKVENSHTMPYKIQLDSVCIHINKGIGIKPFLLD